VLARKRSTRIDRVAIANLTRGGLPTSASPGSSSSRHRYNCLGDTRSSLVRAHAALAALYSLRRHLSKTSSLCHSQFSVLQSVSSFSVSFLGFTPLMFFHWPLSTLTVELGCYPIGLPKWQCACPRARCGSMHGCDYLSLFNKLAR
jgi:hypothetical protein